MPDREQVAIADAIVSEINSFGAAVIQPYQSYWEANEGLHDTALAIMGQLQALAAAVLET